MKAISFKKDLVFSSPQTGDNFEFLKGFYYVWPDNLTLAIQQGLMRNSLDQFMVIQDAEEVFPRFNGVIDKTEISTLMIIRSGGIGDLLALSSIAEYLNILTGRATMVHTMQKYVSVLSWYRTPVMKSHYLMPVKKITDYRRKIQIIPMEGIVEGTRENWYKKFFECLRMPFTSEWARPMLRMYTTSLSILERKSILLVPKSTSAMRSIKFTEIMKALESLRFNGVVYVHRSNLDAEGVNKPCKCPNRFR